MFKKETNHGTSLAVQWLGLCALTAEGIEKLYDYPLSHLRSRKRQGAAKKKKKKKPSLCIAHWTQSYSGVPPKQKGGDRSPWRAVDSTQARAAGTDKKLGRPKGGRSKASCRPRTSCRF